MKGLRLPIGLTLVFAYALATAVFHLEVSLWLVNPLQDGPWAGVRPADLLSRLWPVLAVGGSLLLVLQAWRGSERRRTLLFWGLWVACVVVADHWLIFSTNEYIHYPQYALLAWLTARVVDPRREHWPVAGILLFCTLIGIADEIYQYLHETISYSDYLDFNDFVLNLLGAVAGVLLYYGFRRPPAPDPHLPAAPAAWRGFAALGGVMLLAVSGLGGASAWSPAIADDAGATRLFPLIERAPQRYGHLQRAPHRGRYWILDPWSGSLILSGLGMLFTYFPLRPAGQGPGSGSARGRPRIPRRIGGGV